MAARTAPVAQPERLPLMASCLPRAFSKRQSQPEKSAVMTANDFVYYIALSPSARQATRTWCASGAAGIARPPGPTGTDGSAPRMPKKRPIIAPTPAPNTTPVVALNAQLSWVSHSGFGGGATGDAGRLKYLKAGSAEAGARYVLASSSIVKQ